MGMLIFYCIYEAFMWVFYPILLNITSKSYHNNDIANINRKDSILKWDTITLFGHDKFLIVVHSLGKDISLFNLFLYKDKIRVPCIL